TVAKQKAGVYDKVLECAKEEFLSKGFLDASLRTIAQAAETSTGSIYTRFGDKEGLFRAIAEPVVDQFKAMFRRVQEDFHQLSEEEQRADMGQYTARHQEEMLDYIYDHLCIPLLGRGPAPGFPASWTSWWTSRSVHLQVHGGHRL
ncbi:MAG: TetR/AcrR family transcriptional regulator, partial [Flavonifractor plautii]